MPFGFLAPDGRYWQTDDDPPEALRAAYPADTTEVPIRPGPDHVWTGEAWVHQDPAPEPPSPDFEVTVLQLFDELDETHGLDLEAQVQAVSAKGLRRLRLANAIRRGDPLATVLQSRLNWTDAQVDALFRAAAARG